MVPVISGYYNNETGIELSIYLDINLFLPRIAKANNPADKERKNQVVSQD